MTSHKQGVEILKLLSEYKRLDKKRHVGLTAVESERFEELANTLESFLDKKASGKEPKRKELRVSCSKSLHVRSTADLKKLYIQNISGGGLYVASEGYLAVGSPIEIEIFIEENQRRETLKGVVAWVNTKDIQGLPPGMGIKFSDLTLDQKNFLREVIHTQLDKAIKENPS